MKEVYNNIIYDPEFYSNEWPDIDFPAYLHLEETISDNRFRTAYLVKCNQDSDRKFITTNRGVEEGGVIGKIIWHEPENSNIYYISGLFIVDEYQNRGVGYFLGGSIRSFFAPQGVTLKAPPPSIDQRQNPHIDNIITKWCMKYQDDVDEFLADDGNYYFYSEWSKIFN